LGSINLSRVSEKNLNEIIYLAVRMLDNVIDLNYYPSSSAKSYNIKNRPIGLGVMGYAEFLAKNNIDFESEEHIYITGRLFEKILYHALEASNNLAIERGSYETFKGSLWEQGIFPFDFYESKKLTMDWEDLKYKIKSKGLRNCNLIAIAPTATISNISGTTPCIEPSYSRLSIEEGLSGSYMVNYDPCLKYSENNKYAFDIHPFWIIKAAAERQKWIDQSQSINIFLNGDKVSGKFLSEIYLTAWESGLKTTYYLRVKHNYDVIQPKKEAETQEKFCSLSDDPSCEVCQ
jgi:ribonucleoside-diphosphate reductase alpha chain